MKMWAEKASIRHSITLTWDNSVIVELAKGYDMPYGARSIQHEVDRKILNKLADAHAHQAMQPGARVHVILTEYPDENFALIHKVPKMKIEDIETIDWDNYTKEDVPLYYKLLIENP